MKTLITIFLVLVSIYVYTQSYNQQNGTFYVSTGFYYDSGGPESGYGYDENSTLIFKPSNSNAKLRVQFTYFCLQPQSSCGYDYLNIYNGSGTNQLIGKYCGYNNPGTITSTAADGSLTFTFVSNVEFSRSGWFANISSVYETGDCSAPIVTAKANNIGTYTTVYCSESDIALTSNPQGGWGCSNNNWEYCWFDGYNYWNGNTFASTFEVWSSDYKDIYLDKLVSGRTFTIKARCNNNTLCLSESSVIVNISSNTNPAFLLSDREINTCVGTFTDAGSSSGGYPWGQEHTETFYPCPGNKLTFKFTMFDVATDKDANGNPKHWLKIYNGNSINAPLIKGNGPNGEYYGSLSPFTVSSTAADGSLTFTFHANALLWVYPKGFAANISCSSTPPPCEAPQVKALANNTEGIYNYCETAGLSINLSASIKGGSNCSGVWSYAWFNGEKYWDGAAFTALNPKWAESYNNISTTAEKPDRTYKVIVRCQSDTICSKYSEVTVKSFKEKIILERALGEPANGQTHYINLNWTNTNAITYEIYYSKEGTDWSKIYDFSDTSFNHNTGDNPNAACYYKIRAIYENNLSCAFNQPETAIYTAADEPQVVFTDSTHNSIRLILQKEIPQHNPDYTLYSVFYDNIGKYLNKEGPYSDTPFYYTRSEWDTLTIKDLQPQSKHCFYSCAKNMDGDLRCSKTFCAYTKKKCSAPYSRDILTLISKCENDSLLLRVNIIGTAPFTYQWIKNETNIKDATEATWLIKNLQISDQGYYSCKIINSCGAVKIDLYDLSILPAPVLTLGKDTMLGSSDTMLLDAGTGFKSYLWNDGSKQRFYKVIGSTLKETENIFTVTVSNENNCTNKDTILITLKKLFKLQGYLNYDNTLNSSISKATLILKDKEGKIAGQSIVNDIGFYNMENIESGIYSLQIKITEKWQGVNPIDALLINRYFLNIYKFKSQMKKEAAYVNEDNNINPIDALYINRRFIGLISKYPKSDWLPELIDNINIIKDTELNIKCICRGDVNASFPK